MSETSISPLDRGFGLHQLTDAELREAKRSGRITGQMYYAEKGRRDKTGTEISPQSLAADKEPKTAKMWRILRRDPATIREVTRWIEEKPLPSTYGDLAPDPEQIGPVYGEGEYLLIEAETKYSFAYTYPLTVVAEKKWVAA